jgi:hypothetical protein
MNRRYRESEKHTRPAIYCPTCQQQVEQAWVNVGTSWDPDQWIPGRWICVTPSCAYALDGRTT